ncbi:MAG TPA: endonuclease III domain-containing protein [bacterium]|nr:endonuclease III domain-containing protein [bacterium]
MSLSRHSHYPKSRKLRPKELLKVYKALRRAFGYQHWWPGETPFEVMIGAILTQNTAWTNVERAITNLKKNRCLTPIALKKIREKSLADYIRPAGYFNIKANRIKHFIRFLYDEYKGNVKEMMRERGSVLRTKLLAVRGIGPETADSILLYAANKPFFVIDAYTKRIFARHRLFSFNKPYEEWRALFEKTLPKRTFLYNDFHAQIVMTGKHYCRTRPDCTRCPLKSFL